MKTLYVALYGNIIAELQQDHSGAKRLTYLSSETHGVILSVALPYRTTPYTNKPTTAFIEGLIPESESVRQSLAREFNLTSWKNPFSILEKIGLECAGAVQFIPAEEIDHYQNYTGELVPLPEEDVSTRLQALSHSPHQSWLMDRERWSLAGAQSKFALRYLDGEWYEATGAQPTTHIFKPGIHDLYDQALNEYLCLKTLEKLGLPVARTKYQSFRGTSAIVVERYDRHIRPDGSVLRIHQEDLCQATSTLPFIQGLIANYLLGAPDAHAKNYSLLHLPSGEVRLAPFYDIASGFPYDSLSSSGIPGKKDASSLRLWQLVESATSEK